MTTRYRTDYQRTDPREQEIIQIAECEYCDALPGDYCVQVVMGVRTPDRAYRTHDPRRRLASKIRRQYNNQKVRTGMSSPYSSFRGERESAIEREERRMERALIMAQQAQERIDFLSTLPQEPATHGDACVIFFEKQFNRNGQWYTYAAVKANGLWYSTGPRAPKGFTWDQLVEWMYGGDGAIRNDKIWLATEWEQV